MLYDIALLRANDHKPGMTAAVRQVIEQSKVRTNSNTIRRVRNKYRDFERMFGEVARQYLRSEQYDPVRHADALIGTLARVQQDSELWAVMSRNGWHPVAGWKDGEWIIRRDLWRVLTAEELLRQCAENFARIGLITPAAAVVSNPGGHHAPS